MEIKKVTKAGAKDNVVFLVATEKEIDNKFFNKDEISYIKSKIKDDGKIITINRLSTVVFVVVSGKDEDYKTKQNARKNASKVVDIANENKLESITVISDLSITIDFIEGAILSNYQFLKYYTDKKQNSLKTVNVLGKTTKAQLEEVVNITYATNSAKDLVNEPQSFLNAEQLAEEIKRLGKESGYKVEVLGKAKIEALKMGGLLAVNKGSIDPPTFSVLEWKPKMLKTKNQLF
jgi:leucyl aminopeptidase